MSRFFISPTAAGSRTKFYSSVALFVLALLVAFEISQFVLADDWKSLGFIVIGIAGLAFAVRLNNWRHGTQSIEGFAKTMNRETIAKHNSKFADFL